jgi:hypothetical protein
LRNRRCPFAAAIYVRIFPLLRREALFEFRALLNQEVRQAPVFGHRFTWNRAASNRGRKSAFSNSILADLVMNPSELLETGTITAGKPWCRRVYVAVQPVAPSAPSLGSFHSRIGHAELTMSLQLCMVSSSVQTFHFSRAGFPGQDRPDDPIPFERLDTSIFSTPGDVGDLFRVCGPRPPWAHEL